MEIRFLISDDGVPFDSSDLEILRETLDSLGNEKRTEYRNQNASAIATHNATKFLIVSGPGTGKSHLFLDRINHWYNLDAKANVVVTTFVRKLVSDLHNDITSNDRLSNEQKSKITVSTLHRFARSIVEKNHGTSEWRFKPHFRIIGQFWKDIVWRDVLAFHPNTDNGVHTWKKFEQQMHDNNFNQSGEWEEIKGTYFKLCQFYNAAGFADLILRAAKALAENANLNEFDHFIIDEYQDFNLAEEALINQLTNIPKSLLVVGDDDQVLYEELKSGKPSLIRNLYNNTEYIKGMLPFCGRSTYHITKTAAHFIQEERGAKCIEKIYLPLKTDNNEPKVQVVACATPQTAVDYIEKFVADNREEIDNRKVQLEAGDKKDAYLLILTPAKEVNFYGESKEKLKAIVTKYQTEIRSFSEDYYRLLGYYSLSKNPRNNFTFRKILHYEQFPQDKVHEIIAKAIQDNQDLCDLDFQEIEDTLSKCKKVEAILDGAGTISQKLARIINLVSTADIAELEKDIERKKIRKEEIKPLQHQEEEEAELEEIEVKRMGAVELMTIVGSKGLSADHVIIIGFDNVWMNPVTQNAFFVSIIRARNSLHILTALKSGGATTAHGFLNQLPDAHLEFCKYRKSDQTKISLDNRKGFINYLSYLRRQSRGSR